ncbi:Triacylglycerol lipase [Handroanthus impetiginosus]|uniref:Triacylglycerol lipase n=1 Tax=Handroanthus impetiginosus TaxID=429701 RepID=A0A2G9HDJ4_9LAMI|nr:Triacylglycerol lipase [Handroanthus impetiginosus]
MASLLCHKLISLTSSCFFLSSLLLLLCTPSRAQTVPAMYVFGDSLVDVGNNNHLPLSILKADFPHNGVDYPGKKPTGRYSNGKNAADVLAEKLGLSTAPPYLAQPNNVFLNGVNFASGGAGVVNTTNESIIKQTIPLPGQVGYFSAVRQTLLKQLGSTAVQEHLSKSLFPVVIGSSDLINYFDTGSDVPDKNSPQQYVTLMVSTLKELLKGIYDLGGRKFLFIGVAPIGCAPKQRYQSTTNECNKEANSRSAKYNEELRQMLPELKSELKEFQYTYFDTYSVFVDFIENPATYGTTSNLIHVFSMQNFLTFSLLYHKMFIHSTSQNSLPGFNEIKSACCGLGRLRAKLPCTPLAVYCSNRSDHLFWDIYHPTETALRFFIDKLFSGSGDYVSPMTVQQLIAI